MASTNTNRINRSARPAAVKYRGRGNNRGRSRGVNEQSKTGGHTDDYCAWRVIKKNFKNKRRQITVSKDYRLYALKRTQIYISILHRVYRGSTGAVYIYPRKSNTKGL